MTKLLIALLFFPVIALADMVYTSADGSTITVTDFKCDLDIENAAGMPLREADGKYINSNRIIKGCALEYKDRVEVQLFDEETKHQVFLIIPHDKMEVLK